MQNQQTALFALCEKEPFFDFVKRNKGKIFFLTIYFPSRKKSLYAHHFTFHGYSHACIL